MTSQSTDQQQYSVMLTIDASSYCLSTVDLAVAMAASQKTHLHGLFIEDEDLLRVAGLPFTHEIAFPTAKERWTDIDSMQRSLRAQAGQFKKYLEQAAYASSVQWSYDYVRGRARDIGLTPTAESTYTIVGLAVSHRPKLALLKHTRHVLLVENHSPQILNALKVVMDRLGNESIQVTVIRNGDDTQSPAAVVLQTITGTAKQVSTAVYEHKQLSERLAETVFDYVIASRYEPFDNLREILNRSQCPVILVA